MAVVSMWSRVSYKSHVHLTVQSMRQIGRNGTEYSLPLQKDCRCLSHPLICEMDTKWNVSPHESDLFSKADGKQVFRLVYNRYSPLRKTTGMHLLGMYKTEGREKCRAGRSSTTDETYHESDLLKAESRGKQLKELDSYFSKLHYNTDEQLRSCGNGSDVKEHRMESSSQLEDQQTKFFTPSKPCKRQTTLDSLENYFGELNTVPHLRKETSSSPDKEKLEGHPIQRPNTALRGYNDDIMIVEPNSVERLESMIDEAGYISSGNENSEGLQTDDEASDFYLINLLVAINIAIFLFEIASPVKSSDAEILSLPLVYGAKINKLILVGEWWRLLTPMFLHTGFVHVALSCWLLLTFGPQVCKGYGPFTFLLIYILGGICGNLTSFIHTPELTVCGTGPVFAVIGAWLVYQIQNKQVVEKELSESLFWKAVAATALSFVLSNVGRIDDWTHLGATFSGIIFGYLTCPTLQFLNNALSSKDGQKQNIALAQRQADPCKSLLVFAISIFTLSCLVFFYGPQLQLLEVEDFI